MEETLRRLGQRIRDIRIARGFSSQEAFADYIKMHRTFIGHLETGRKDFRFLTLIRVAEALGVSLSELFEGVDTAKPLKGVVSKTTGRYAALKEIAVLESSIARLKSQFEQKG